MAKKKESMRFEFRLRVINKTVCNKSGAVGGGLSRNRFSRVYRMFRVSAKEN